MLGRSGRIFCFVFLIIYIYKIDFAGCFSFARLAAAVKSRRAKYPDSLLLDGGDQYQGTLWFYKYHGNVTSHFMNWVHYDAMVSEKQWEAD